LATLKEKRKKINSDNVMPLNVQNFLLMKKVHGTNQIVEERKH
jgi:hypothetical protein